MNLLNQGAFNLIEKYGDGDSIRNVFIEASKQQFSNSLLEKSLNFIIHQFNEFEKVMHNQEDQSLSDRLRKDFDDLLQDKKKLKIYLGN